jgi:hypothetical protein
MDQRAVQLVEQYGSGILTPVGAANNSEPDVPIAPDRKYGSGGSVYWRRDYWTGYMQWDAEAGAYYVADATVAHRFRPNPG